jgi:hypothetical protein
VSLFTGSFADVTEFADTANQMLGLAPWKLALLSDFASQGAPRANKLISTLNNSTFGVAATTWIFDSANRKVVRQPTGGDAVEYGAEQIAGFPIESLKEGDLAGESDGTTLYPYTYRLSLQLKSGELLPLKDSGSLERAQLMHDNRARLNAEETAMYLRNFLGMLSPPAASVQPTNVTT